MRIVTGCSTAVLRIALAATLVSGVRSTCAASEPAGGGEGKGARKARFTYWPLKPGRAVAADRRAVCRQATGAVWRYDVKTRSLQSFSILDGVWASSRNPVVLGQDGSFAIGYNWGYRSCTTFVWRPGKGWTALKGLGRGGIAFDAQGRILFGYGNPQPKRINADPDVRMCTLKRVAGDRLVTAGRVPGHRRLYPVDQGYFFWDYVPVKGRAPIRLGYARAGSFRITRAGSGIGGRWARK